MYDAFAYVQEENVKEQVAEGSCKAQACSYRGTSGRCKPLARVKFEYF